MGLTPKYLIQIGRIAFVLGVVNAVLFMTKSVPGDPMLISLVILIGVVTIVGGNCLKSLNNRITKIEENISPRKP